MVTEKTKQRGRRSVSSKRKLLHVPRPGKDYTLNLPKDHLSYSQVDLYRRCPEKYYRRVILGEKEPKTWPLIEGSAMSSTLEASNKHKVKKGKHLSLRKVVGLHAGFVDSQFDEHINDLDADCSTDELKSRGEKFLEKFWDGSEPDLEPCTVDGKPGVELKIKTEFGGIPFICIPDLIEPGCVLDFKVAASTRFYKPDDDLQLSLYAVAAQRTRVAYYVFCKKNGKIELLIGNRDLKRTLRWCDLVVGRVAFGISMGVFPPTDPSKDFLCNPQWCHWWDTCYGACS